MSWCPFYRWENGVRRRSPVFLPPGSGHSVPQAALVLACHGHPVPGAAALAGGMAKGLLPQEDDCHHGRGADRCTCWSVEAGSPGPTLPRSHVLRFFRSSWPPQAAQRPTCMHVPHGELWRKALALALSLSRASLAVRPKGPRKTTSFSAMGFSPGEEKPFIDFSQCFLLIQKSLFFA